MDTQNRLNDQIQKDKDIMRKMEEYDLHNTKRKAENKLMMDIMEIESQKWPTLENMD